MNIELPKHWIPVNLLGAAHHYTQAAHQYAEAYARAAIEAHEAQRAPPAVPSKMVAELRKMADPDNGWQYGDGLPMADDAMAILHALASAPPAPEVVNRQPQASKPLFSELIAQHEGLAEELQASVVPEKETMNENTGGAFYATDSRNWWQRLLGRMFPAKLAPRLEDKEGWAPGYMITEVIASLDWRDRLRVLVSGKVHVSTSTRTDVNVSKVHSETAVWVDAP